MSIKLFRQKIRNKVAVTQFYLKSKYYNFRKPSVVNIKEVKIGIPKNASKELKQALYFGFYEYSELKIVTSQLSLQDTVMELGTGLGLLSIFCARKIGDNRVFTYEANPELESIIKYNYRLNKVSPELQMYMLGAKSERKSFYVSENLWDSSSVQHHQNLKHIQVSVKSLNEEIRKNNPSFLIIDIEGGEYEICKYINFHNIKKILIELHENFIGIENTKFVKLKLEEAGFRINNKFSYRQRNLNLFLERD